MKRTPKINPLEIHVYRRIKTIFTWHKCLICGQEFRREYGWEIQALNTMIRPRRWFDPEYICMECISSEEELISYLQAEEKRLNTPPKIN